MFEIIVLTSQHGHNNSVVAVFFLHGVGGELCVIDVLRCPSTWYLYQLEHSGDFCKTRRTCPEFVTKLSHRRAPRASVGMCDDLSTLTFCAWSVLSRRRRIRKRASCLEAPKRKVRVHSDAFPAISRMMGLNKRDPRHRPTVVSILRT